MKLSEFAVKHPVVITMILIVLAVFGIVSVRGMPSEFMSDMTMPQAIVFTVYPGASAEDVESDVTKILEDNFVTLPHFKRVDSSSYNSLSVITITYADGIEALEQLEELRFRISELKELLPDGIQGEPRAVVGGMSMMPVISFTVSAGNDSGRVTEFIKDELTPRITQIDGVSQVQIEGGKEIELSIKLDADLLASRGISVLSVYQILNYGNVSLPLGNSDYENRSINVRYSGAFKSLEDIKKLPVGYSEDKTIIHLEDVAQICLDYPESDYTVTDGENPIILVGVTKRNDGDTIKIVRDVKKVLEYFKKSTNGAVHFSIISDDSRQIKASQKTVIQSGIMGVVFAILVILLFLADWRATLTIGFSIPLCVLFSFIGLRIFNISINLMSLTGLVCSLGMVVDGSTVMLEQIYGYYSRRAPDGKTLYTVNQSIFKGYDEVALSIFASSATTIVTFLPIALLTGLIGKTLHTVAITIMMAIFASFLVAIIVVPYLLKLLLRNEGPKIRTKPRKFTLFMQKLERGYKRLLKFSLNHRIGVVFFALALLIFSGFIATRLGLAFIPATDSGDFYLYVDFPIGTKIEQTRKKMEVVRDLIKEEIPEVESAIFYTGRTANRGILSVTAPESAYVHVILRPLSQRKRDVHDISRLIRLICARSIPDATVSVENGGFDKLVGYVSGGGGYGLTLISEDLNLLYDTAKEIKEFLEKDPDVVSASLDTDFDTTTMIIDMSQEYLSSLGLSSYEAGLTSGILFQGVDAGRYKDEKSGERYNIHLCSNLTDKNITRDDIANIHIITDRGQDISFANLSDIRVEKSISQINHSNRAKTITVSAKLVSENTADVSRRVKEYLSENPLPNGVESSTGGIVALVNDMLPPMLSALFIAVFLIYTVMVLQFERFKQPLVIMVTIPFCFIGVVLGLLIFGSTMNLLSLMGIISLAGVVVNNGIILVDYINQLRKSRREEIAKKKGYQDRDGQWLVELTNEEELNLLSECIADGSASRIQPILITTLTTLLGDIPMALSHGEGSEIYAPMGQAIAGGLLTSTLITLILIPVLYYLTERKSAIRMVKRQKNREKTEIKTENIGLLKLAESKVSSNKSEC